MQRLRARRVTSYLLHNALSLPPDRLGYAHFRRWRLCGEEALARHSVVIWLLGEALTIEHAETPLAKYQVQYQPDKKHFRGVPAAGRYKTPYRPAQGQLWELDDQLCKLAIKLRDYASCKGRPRLPDVWQDPLFPTEEAASSYAQWEVARCEAHVSIS